MRILLRQARAADHAALLDLWEAAWSVAMPSIDFAARRPWMTARLDELIGTGTRIVLASANADTLVGFVTVDPVTHLLDQLAVHPAAQRRGIAIVLLHEARRLSPRGLILTVNQANAPAVSLYRRAGFAVVEAGINDRSGLPIWHMRWPGEGSAPEARPGHGLAPRRSAPHLKRRRP